MHAVLSDAGLQRCPELRAVPAPDARLLVRRDVGGQHIPERRLDRPASREWLATARNGVTGCAVRRDCQVLALLNEAEVLFVDRVASGAVSEADEADASGSGQQFCAVTHGQAAPDF